MHSDENNNYNTKEISNASEQKSMVKSRLWLQHAKWEVCLNEPVIEMSLIFLVQMIAVLLSVW